jgi:hypothetical protein
VIESAINTLLRGDAQIVAMTAGRIRPVALAQDDRKADGTPLARITYQNISYESINAHDGPSVWAHAHIQIDCMAATQLQTVTLANHVQRVLHYYVGTVGTIAEIRPCLLDTRGDQEQLPYEGQEKPVYRVTNDYRLLFRLL